ncbi:hypothetical protein [Streptomyces fragilis]|uniref:Uncharacterized protein n=1 Tax=Streptomyces fragilis TaxID=67301 RepID=A0ABV2YCM4_9ACTN|nr:hypothetical protein [Streptomyces fragilis]
MGCSHATGCPLFPLLRESLRGWRDYYCDSNDQWRGCARYKMSLTGERVPISLLPNGAQARHFEDAGDAGGTCAPASGQAPPQAVRREPWSPQDAYGEPQGAYPYREPQGAYGTQPPSGRPPAPSGLRVAAPESVTPWATETPSVPLTLGRPSPSPHTARHHAPPAQQAPRASRPKRGLWARLTDWMSRPA